jgi:hypothetical protein
MAHKPNQPSIVPDCYLVMARRPKPKKKDGLSDSFTSCDEMSRATQKMAEEIRKLARKHGETIQLECGNLQAAGVLKLKCDRYFAELVKDLPCVAHIEPERSVYPPNKTPKFNR